MKLLGPGPEPLSYSERTFVVFAVTHPAGVLNLKEVGRVRAGNDATALISAAEATKVGAAGELVAIPLDELHIRRVRVRFFVTFDETSKT